MRAAACLTAVFLCICAIPISAGTQDDAVVALHSPYIFIKGDPCFVFEQIYGDRPCADLEVQQSVEFDSYIWLLLARADSAAGISELSCGVNTSSDLVQVYEWHLCADEDLQTGPWPHSGGGNRIVWNAETNCRRSVIDVDGVHALAGWFSAYAYGAGTFDITPNGAESKTVLEITACAGVVSELTTPGASIGFGNAEGYNPCAEDVPVVPQTWGRIKQQYTN